jgi:hypothetical protein
MDFGLSRVIEMFEERFGRIAATALVGLIAVALACLSVQKIVEILVVPTYGVALKIASGGAFGALKVWMLSITKTDIFAAILWGAGAAFFTHVYFRFIKWRALRSVKRELTEHLEEHLEKYVGQVLVLARAEILRQGENLLKGPSSVPLGPEETSQTR